MDDNEIVTMLAHIKNNHGAVEDITPPSVLIKIKQHSTAIHCSVYLTMENEPQLLIWYKTNWVSSGYEFNEQGKTVGVQPGCSFAEPILQQLFSGAEKFLQDKAAKFKKEKARKEALERTEKNRHRNVYKAAFSTTEEAKQ